MPKPDNGLAAPLLADQLGRCGGPAYPICSIDLGNGAFATHPGMSYRDACAIAAMQGMLASPELLVIVSAGDINDGTASERIAQAAYRQADAMVKVKEG